MKGVVTVVVATGVVPRSGGRGGGTSQPSETGTSFVGERNSRVVVIDWLEVTGLTGFPTSPCPVPGAWL